MDRKLKKLVKRNAGELHNSPMDFASVYRITFENNDLILSESFDGYRIRRRSYAQVRQRIEQVSRALYARIGATHGYVGLEMENCEEWVVAFWAILRSGNKPYLINCRHPESLSNNLLKSLNIKNIVALKESRLNAETLLFEELTDGEAFPAVFEDEFALPTSGTSLKETICFYRGKQISMGILNACTILKNSPRMAALYHGSLKQLAFLPFYHVFGLMAVMFWFSFFGRTLVFLQDYAPDTILKTCRRHEVTHVFAVPMLWHTVEKQVWRNAREQGKEEKLRRGLRLCTKLQNVFPNLGTFFAKRIMKDVTSRLFGDSIQFCISGGSYLRSSALELINGLGYPLHNGYGMSELGITSVELRSRPRERNRNSIGRPFDSVEYRIAQDGTLHVRGNSICPRVMVNGKMMEVGPWVETGDIVTCENGDYYIRGRIGDMVLGENGENINPDVIEAHFHPEEAVNLCVLGLGEGENQELSMILQISPYLSRQKIQKLTEQLYAVNESLPDTSRVRKFYFTHDAIMAPTAIKVSRKALYRNLESGAVKLTTATEMKTMHSADEALDCNPQLYAKVREVIARELDKDEADIGPDEHIIFDLGGTSLQYFAILSELSQEFGVSAPSDQEEYRYTLREFCQYIERHM